MSKPKIVNVAAVRKLSPFRYPGGKTWLVPYARTWLSSLSKAPDVFLEPFTGGGIIGLTVGFESLAKNVILVELDEDVAAVWKTILGSDAKWLCKKIESFEISTENVRAEMDKKPSSVRQRAFQTILKNRTYHGGILAAGSGLIKQGEAGKGVASRWYAKTLSLRIQEIYDHRAPFEFIQGDGLDVLESMSGKDNLAVFIDPPYTAGKNGKRAGKRLYNHNQLDHERLFEIASRLKGSFLMTYDNDTEVRALAEKFGFQTGLVAMKNTHHAEMTELVISRDLSWLNASVTKAPRNRWLFDPDGKE